MMHRYGASLRSRRFFFGGGTCGTSAAQANRSGITQYLADEIQNNCMNILSIPRDNAQMLQERKNTTTIEKFRQIKMNHPCNNKFIPSAISHIYDHL